MWRRRISKKLTLTGVVFVTAFAACSVVGQTPATNGVCETLPGRAAEREMGGTKVECYNVSLPKDYYFRVHVEQKCVDVTLKLSDAKGSVVAEVDSFNGIQGPEIISIIVPETGSYRLEVKASAGQGKYTIVQEALRPPTDADRKQIEAQAITARAQAEASPPAALALLQKAAELLLESGDKEGAGRVFYEAGYLANAVGDRDSSLRFYDRARMLYQAIPNQFEEARTLIGVGAVHFGSGAMREAVGYFHKADQLMKDACPLDRADAQQGLAKGYLRLSEWEKSLESFNKALELFRAVPYPSGVAQTLSNMGLVHLELAQKQKALDKFNEALDVVREHGFAEDEVAVLNNIGRAYDDMGRILDARKQFELALEKAKEIRGKQAEVQPKDKLAEASITLNLGKTYLDLGDGEEALAKFEKSRDLFKEVGDRFGEINAINFVGRAYCALGNERKGLEQFHLALRLFRNFGSKRGEALTFGNLMLAWKSLGNPRLAIFFGKQSINVLQQIRDTARRIDDESLRSFTATVEGTYRTLAALLVEEGRVAEAQEVLGLLKQEELSRFAQSGQNLPSNPLLPIALNKEEGEAELKYKGFEDEFTRLTRLASDLRREKATLEQQGQTLPAEKQDDLQKQQADLNRRFEKFLQELPDAFSLPTAKADREPPSALTKVWQNRLAELGNGTVLVTTWLTGGHYYVIITTPGSQIARSQQIRQADLTGKITQLRLVLRDPSTQEHVFLALTNDLYKLLVEPIAADLQRLNARTLLLSLDGELRYVPFAALHDGQSFLVEKYASAVVTLAQPPDNKRDSPQAWRALGVGVSRQIGDNPPLPQVPCELSSVVANSTTRYCKRAGVFPGEILLDRKFTWPNLVARLKSRPRPRLLHMATHFLLSSEKDINSYLLLGDGGQLRLDDLRLNKGKQLDMSDVDLLTLSACDTGAKETNDANGVEIENLGVIVQRRGAKAVMASLWYLQDNRTPELMADFYRGYKDGKGNISKAEALRRAQLKKLKGDGAPPHKYLHPAYWAAFIVIGNL